MKKHVSFAVKLASTMLICSLAFTSTAYADDLISPNPTTDTVTENTVSGNTASGNTASGNTVSGNTSKNDSESGDKKPVLTGWQTINGYKYYYTKKGNYVTGVKKINGHYYYFSKKGRMLTGWRTYNSKTYYFTKAKSAYGQAVTGLVRISGKYYCFGKKCTQITGWKTVNGNKYYFYPSGSEIGAAAYGLTEIDGTVYYFNKNGTLQSDYVADTYDKKVWNTESDTNYRILVSLSDHKVAIYKGSSNHWTRIKTFTCTAGANATPTVKGTFKMGAQNGKAYKMLYFDADGGVRCWYASRITGGYLFHSVLYWPTDSPRASAIANGTLGANLSHGCIRLALKDAKYIHKMIPEGTSCTIY